MDTIKFQKTLEDIPEVFNEGRFEVDWQGLPWFRDKKGNYSSEIKNLRLNYKSGYLSISNSLHKFYHGNNHCLFTYKEMVDAIEQLNDRFEFSIYDARVIKYTPGLVIEATPDESYNNWLSYKSKYFTPMKANGKTYGLSLSSGRANIKGYNKTFEVNKRSTDKITKSLFRFEIEVYARYIAKNYGIPINYVSDLVKKGNYISTLILLMRYYDNIKLDNIDFSKLDCNQTRLMGIFTNQRVLHHFKKNHPHSCKKDRNKFNAILKNDTCKKNDPIRHKIIHTMGQMVRN